MRHWPLGTLTIIGMIVIFGIVVVVGSLIHMIRERKLDDLAIAAAITGLWVAGGYVVAMIIRTWE